MKTLLFVFWVTAVLQWILTVAGFVVYKELLIIPFGNAITWTLAAGISHAIYMKNRF